MERDQQDAGDYGYDLAHEETGRPKAPGDRTADPHGGSASPTRATDEAATDLGYDEAHDF